MRTVKAAAAATDGYALERRIRELEQLAHAQGHELRIQFERIAQLQADYDIWRIRHGDGDRQAHVAVRSD